MDIEIDLFINGVPDEATARDVCNGIRLYLLDNHNTDIFVDFEEV